MDDVDPTIGNAKRASREANTLIEMMEYMNEMAPQHERNHHDYIYHLASKGKYSLIKIALEVMKMNPNRRDKHGKTSLDAAMSNSRPDALQLLLDKGADPFRCNNDGRFCMDYNAGNSANAVLCRERMNEFVRVFLDRHQTTLPRLKGQANYRMKKVDEYRSIVKGLLDIDEIKKEILHTIESDRELFTDLKKVTELLHGFDPVESVFDYSVPGVTTLDPHPKMQEWYVDEEVCRLNWSHDIKHYFTLVVERMNELDSICKLDTSPNAINLLQHVREANRFLVKCG